mgnify:CR=1 FL=1|jgi:hypothetical protein
MDTRALYRSPAHRKNFGNADRINADRIELKSILLFRTVVIPSEEIAWIDRFRPLVLRAAFWAPKLGLADLYGHVGIVRKSEWFKQLRFAPDDPEAFVGTAKAALAAG